MKTFNDLEFKKRELLFEEDEWGLCYSTPITNDVLGYLTAEKVTEVMRKIQELN